MYLLDTVVISKLRKAQSGTANSGVIAWADEIPALHVPDPAPVRDSLIGATALVHGMVVVTCNSRDFERFPNLEIVDPWT